MKIGIINVSDRASRGEYEGLPGKPKAIAECLEAVFPAIPYCVDLIGGPRMETHDSEMKVFRPKAGTDTNA